MEKANKKHRTEMREVMKNLDIKNMEDINELFKEMVGSVLENGLESELDEELGYSKHDYKNRATDNYRNGHSKKSVKSSFGEVYISVPRDRNGEFEPVLVKKHQTNVYDVEDGINHLIRKGHNQLICGTNERRMPKGAIDELMFSSGAVYTRQSYRRSCNCYFTISKQRFQYDFVKFTKDQL